MNLLKALRPSQAIKNFLIFIPLFSQGNFSISDIYILINIFIGFSFVVSSTYILNDILDIESDKLHPTKKFRPVTSSLKPLYFWKVIFFFFFLIGIVWLYFTNTNSLVVTFIYCIVTLLYSIKLKYLKYFDLITIAFLFVLRIYVGSLPLSIPLSNYIILFVLFTSLGLVAGKKYSILNNDQIQNSKIKIFLEKSYNSMQLLTITGVGFIISLSTYLSWIIFVKKPIINELEFYSLVLSFICLLIFKYFFFINTKKSTTEDIFEFIKNKKIVSIWILLFLLSALFGLLT
jgi:decaprenyl-phosphate phosphoribosyltransferase